MNMRKENIEYTIVYFITHIRILTDTFYVILLDILYYFIESLNILL